MEHSRPRDSLTFRSHLLNNVSQLEPERVKGKHCSLANHHGNLISHPVKARKQVGFMTPSSEQFKQNIQNNYNFKYPIKYSHVK